MEASRLAPSFGAMRTLRLVLVDGGNESQQLLARETVATARQAVQRATTSSYPRGRTVPATGVYVADAIGQNRLAGR